MREKPWGRVRRTPGTAASMRSEAVLSFPSRRLLGVFAAMTLILSLMAVYPLPAFGGPKGGDQQGTVKIHEGPGEPSPEVRNEPKVCTFHIHGFNFHAGENIVWWIQEKGNQGWGATVLSGTGVADQDGDWRDPDGGAYSLPEGHYKLNVDRAPEFDPPIKHKVFKVDCLEVAATSTTTAPTTTSTTTAVGGVGVTTTTAPTTTTTTTAVGGVGVTTTTAPTTTTTAAVGGVGVTTSTTTVEGTTTTTLKDQVLGTVITTSTTAPVTPVAEEEVEAEVLAAQVQAEELPFTGITNERLIGLAVLLLAGGLVVLGSTGKREES